RLRLVASNAAGAGRQAAADRLQSLMHQSRRDFLQFTVAAAFMARQPSAAPAVRSVQTPVLDIGFEESGNPQGFPIILLHGFPDDVRAWDGVVGPLAKDGYRVLVPYLRGYGTTRFRNPASPRMAEQAAIGQDLIDFAEALGMQRVARARQH